MPGRNEAVVIIMAKQPQAGSTKTRLCPPLLPEQAAQLYEAMLRDSIALVSSQGLLALAVAFSPPESYGYFEAITPQDTILLPVTGNHIGECLDRALEAALSIGFGKALALNADGPSLPPETLLEAVRLLDDHDMVFGPGEDGGYYLVGLKSPAPQVFQRIDWSTSRVLRQSLARAVELGLRAALTRPWFDVDYFEDLQRLRRELLSLPGDRLIHTRAVLAGIGFG